MVYVRIIIALAALLVLGLTDIASARNDNAVAIVEPDLSDQIITFIQSTTTDQSDRQEFSRSDYPIIELVSALTDAVIDNDRPALRAAIIRAEERDIANINPTKFNQALEFAKTIDQISPDNFHSQNETALLEYLVDIPSEYDWYLQSTSLLLAGYLNIPRRNFLVASNFFEDANAIIPSDLSPSVTEARLQASVMTTLLHGIQGNVEFLFDSAKTEYEMRSRMGDEINRHELIINFIYAFNQKRDFTSAAKFRALIDEQPQTSTTVPGLVETYLAETYLELKDYTVAESLSREALSKLNHPTIENRVNSILLVALAGQGKVREARTIMRSRNWEYGYNDLLTSETIIPRILMAEALIALYEGRLEQSQLLFLRHTDRLISRMQSTNGADMTALLANLENTRERQLERETALQREAELKAVQLEQQQRLNLMLQITLGLLAGALIALLIFLRYRERNNAKLRALTEEALSAERMKIEFLGVVNHELRTPLNGIIGMSDALIHHAKDPLIKSKAQTIQDSGQVLFDMIKSLIDMSTLDNGKMTLDSDEMSPAEVIAAEAHEWEASAHEKGLTFTCFISDDLQKTVLSDDDRIAQCVRILLSNAMRFTQEGRVHLHATAAQRDDHSEMKLIVADTGQGMSETVQERLFTPFLQADLTMTRKHGGVGLSLAIARQLARLMGGDLTVTSRDGRGSEFVFTARLPLAEETPTDVIDHHEMKSSEILAEKREADISRRNLQTEDLSDSEQGTESPDPNRSAPVSDNESQTDSDEALFDIVDLMSGQTAFEDDEALDVQSAPASIPDPSSDIFGHAPTNSPHTCVLIVEDEQSNRDVIRVLLEPEGYECLQVEGAQDALDLLDQRPVDLILMDIRMPEMTGIEAIEQIRSRPDDRAELPIVVLTADAKEDTREQSMRAGADLFLTKPIDRRTLLAAIDRGLQKARTSRTSRTQNVA